MNIRIPYIYSPLESFILHHLKISMKNRPFREALFLCTISIMLVHCQSNTSSEQLMPGKKFVVTPVPAENGSYTVSPELPADSLVAAGTTLTVKATPDAGYSLDAVYYTLPFGMWGTTSYESFTPEIQVPVDTNVVVGATFVESALVENLNVTHDVVYAKPGVKPLKYDVFAPKGAQNLPAIVIIHGGGWSSNNEDIMRGLARELTRGNQYVVFSIDYRWVNKLDGDDKPNYMHQLIEDVLGAINHIRENAGKYGADTNRIAVTGDSAGGHLSAAAAVFCAAIGDGGFGEKEGVYEYMPSYMPEGKTADQVRDELTQAIKAAAPSYGPFNAADFKMFIEQTDQAYWDAVSPIKLVPNAKKRAIPHFIVHGADDPVVKTEAIQPYIDVLKAAGQTVEFVQVPGAGHAFFDWKPDARTRATFKQIGVPYAAQMKAFFDKVFYAK